MSDAETEEKDYYNKNEIDAIHYQLETRLWRQILNAWNTRKYPINDERRKAAHSRLLIRLFFSPEVAATGGISIAIFTLIFLGMQTAIMENTRSDNKKTNDLLKEQSNTMLKFKLLDTLYDEEKCLKEPDSNLCPLRANSKAREAALLAYIALERSMNRTPDLRGVRFDGMEFAPGLDLKGVDLRDSRLMHATLYGANFQGANLKGAKFLKSDLRCANFASAQFETTMMIGARVCGADFSESSVTRPRLVFAGVIHDKTTIPPQGQSYLFKEKGLSVDAECKSQEMITDELRLKLIVLGFDVDSVKDMSYEELEKSAKELPIKVDLPNPSSHDYAPIPCAPLSE